jgi:hypothetical protein
MLLQVLEAQHSLKKQMYAIVLSINQHPSKQTTLFAQSSIPRERPMNRMVG